MFVCSQRQTMETRKFKHQIFVPLKPDILNYLSLHYLYIHIHISYKYEDFLWFLKLEHNFHLQRIPELEVMLKEGEGSFKNQLECVHWRASWEGKWTTQNQFTLTFLICALWPLGSFGKLNTDGWWVKRLCFRVFKIIIQLSQVFQIGGSTTSLLPMELMKWRIRYRTWHKQSSKWMMMMMWNADSFQSTVEVIK